MKDRKFVVLKDIVLKKGEIIDNFACGRKENLEYDTVIGLNNDHVILPKLSEVDIEELLKSGYIEEVPVDI